MTHKRGGPRAVKDQTTAPRWTSAPAADVCAYIAAAAMSRDATAPSSVTLAQAAEQMGRISLRAHQREAVARIQVSLERRGGALLADAVGLGKTYVALAIARGYAHAHVITPAALLPMWRQAIAATESPNVTLHSLHSLSRRALRSGASHGRTLTIVDEAHHLRTRTTVRYRHAQQFVATHDVLLLSATPVHNRARELRTLLSLFLGNRADVLDRQTLAECVIRRTGDDELGHLVPKVEEHVPHSIPENRQLLECILQLAPPLPVNDGAAASALVRLGLLRAWCSSDAALTDRIRRRQLRGEALLHSLVHGRYPTKRELESWIVGNDAVQLGFPELLVATASDDTATMLKTLVAHLDALQHLLQLHTRTSNADASRASTLRALLCDDSERPIVAFSQFASTVRALHRALCDLAGVASLTSDGGMIASGAIARHELISNFAPKASGRPPPAAAQRIRLLLSTDLLAEGVNLQDAGTVIHLDLPWTHALKQQRVGRVARMGSGFDAVHVHTLAPPMGAEAALHMVATLERKAGLHRDWIGAADVTHESDASAAMSAPDEATLLRKMLRAWQTPLKPVAPAPLVLVATVRAAISGWIAVVGLNGALRVVASGDGMVSTETTTLLKVIRTVGRNPAHFAGTDHGRTKHAAQVGKALHEVDSWLQTQQLQTMAGDSPRSLSHAQRVALDTLSFRIRDTSAIRRVTLARQASRTAEQILNSRGAESEKRLVLWCGIAASTPIAAWLQAVPDEGATRTLNAPPAVDSASSIVALLMLDQSECDALPHAVPANAHQSLQ